MREADMTTIDMIEYALTIVELAYKKLETLSCQLYRLEIDEEEEAGEETLTSCEINTASEYLESATSELMDARSHLKKAIKEKEKEDIEKADKERER